VLIGAALALTALHNQGGPPRALASLHGLSALAGYALLLVALQGPARGTATGTQSFGIAAAILLLLAAMIGVASVVIHMRRRRLPGFWAGAHAMVAIAGYVIVAVYLLAG
jgi:hypothetical protein